MHKMPREEWRSQFDLVEPPHKQTLQSILGAWQSSKEWEEEDKDATLAVHCTPYVLMNFSSSQMTHLLSPSAIFLQYIWCFIALWRAVNLCS